MKYNMIYKFATLGLATGIFLSCAKEGTLPKEELKPEPEDSTAINTGNFYKLIRVENFKGDTTDSYAASKATLYYSLEANTAVTVDYQKTSRWDLAFGGLYNLYLSGNAGGDPTNNGSGASGAGGILIVQKSFDDITDIPADDQFKTGRDLVGLDDAGAFGSGIGWALYDFGGELIRDGAYDNMHICYALGLPLTLNSGMVVPARTIIVRTAKGSYAKIRMVSAYKDAFTIDKWFRNTPHMYFTFEYVMVPKGSKKFEIKP